MARKLHTCPCCGYKTIKDSYDICHICRWEYEYSQVNDPDNDSGPNVVSLRVAQRNYLKFGACTWEERVSARKPSFLDRKDREWRLLEGEAPVQKSQEIPMPNNDIVEIFMVEGGGYWCPICGDRLHDLPWNVPEGANRPSGSLNPCPGCKTTFGIEDAVATDSPKGMAIENWKKLRIKWLDELGWPDWAMKQIHDHLGVDFSEFKPKH